jgi:sugar/nucleoside kinase (ribokinase family)
MARFDVTIAGELNLDLILYGLPDELSPERELLADRMMLTLGSSSAILAHNLSSLGTHVGFQSLIGDDQLGSIARERLEQAGVDTSRVRQVAGLVKTGLSVILQRQGWRNILTYPGTIAELSREDLDLAFLADSRHFHLSSFFLQKKLRPHVSELFQKLKHAGLTISLDTNDDSDDRWDGGLQDVMRHVDIFFPNEREACRITRSNNPETAAKCLAEIVPLVVVKLGPEGAMARRGNERFASPALRVTAVDPVGAGDSFDAGFLHQYLHGADVQTCLDAGNLAGALSTTCSGGTEAFRDRAHRESFFRRHSSPS